MIVGKKMTKNPITVTRETSVTEAQSIMRREKVHRLPVVNDKGVMVGIITESDVLYASPSPASTLNMYEMSYLLSKLTVQKVMNKKVITVTEDMALEDAARIMADNDIGGLPVVRNGRLTGIITESDIFKTFIELFGARRKGIRATVIAPERRGELADIAIAVRDKGGNFISFVTALGDDSTKVLCTLKVEGISKEDLIWCLKPVVEEIIDIREA